MLTSERAPLLNEAQVDKNGVNKWHKFIKYSSILLILIICGVVSYQLYPSQPLAQNNAFVEENEIAPISNPDLEDDGRELVTIEYDMDDLPQSVSTLDITALQDNDEMKQFHQDLIAKSGYNTDDYRIQFFVMDKEEADTRRRLPPAINELKCGTIYTDTDSQSGTLKLNCAKRRSDPGFAMTGCVAYDEINGGKRWGETGYYTTECYTRQLNGNDASLSARCCKIDGPASISTSYSVSYTSVSKECGKSFCPSGRIATGCTASVSDRTSEHTVAFSGVQRKVRPNSGLSGCQAQRGAEPGYLWIAPYCATIADGDLKCKVVEGSAFNGHTLAAARCEVGKGWRLTDCNGIIKDEMDQCSAGSIMDYGISYGGTIAWAQCVAHGSTDSIVAQATCCKII